MEGDERWPVTVPVIYTTNAAVDTTIGRYNSCIQVLKVGLLHQGSTFLVAIHKRPPIVHLMNRGTPIPRRTVSVMKPYPCLVYTVCH